CLQRAQEFFSTHVLLRPQEDAGPTIRLRGPRRPQVSLQSRERFGEEADSRLGLSRLRWWDDEVDRPIVLDAGDRVVLVDARPGCPSGTGNRGAVLVGDAEPGSHR